MASTEARLVALMRAWTDHHQYATGHAGRLQIAREIVEQACKRLSHPVVLVQSDCRRDDGGLATFGHDGWAFTLTVERIGGRVRARIDQVLLREGRLHLGTEWPAEQPILLEARGHLIDRLRQAVDQSRHAGDCGGKGDQWFGALGIDQGENWKDHGVLVLDSFVNPMDGLLWDIVGKEPHWRAARWAWLTYWSPLRQSTFLGAEGESRENWTWMDEEELIAKVASRRRRGWVVRKWPDSPDRGLATYDEDELRRAISILREARNVDLRMAPDTIPISELRKRPQGATIQQRACHYLVKDKGLTTTRVAELLGFKQHTDVARMVREVDAKLRNGASRGGDRRTA